MSEKAMRKAAKPMLFLAAFIWGSSFFIMKDALDQLPVQYLLAIRFTTGAILLGLFCWKKWRTFTTGYLLILILSLPRRAFFSLVRKEAKAPSRGLRHP